MANISDSIVDMLDDTQDSGSSQAADQPPPPPAPEKAEPHKQFSGGLEHIRSGDDPAGVISAPPVDTIEPDKPFRGGGQTRSTPDPGAGPPTEGGLDADFSEK